MSMRNLGIALGIAWMSVSLDLLWLPPSQLRSEMALSRDFIESMQDSPDNIPDYALLHPGYESQTNRNPS